MERRWKVTSSTWHNVYFALDILLQFCVLCINIRSLVTSNHSANADKISSNTGQGQGKSISWKRTIGSIVKYNLRENASTCNVHFSLGFFNLEDLERSASIVSGTVSFSARIVLGDNAFRIETDVSPTNEKNSIFHVRAFNCTDPSLPLRRTNADK